MKPFNLEQALAGNTVVTRAGYKVTSMSVLKGEQKKVVCCLILIPSRTNGNIANLEETLYTMDASTGKLYFDRDNAVDLFMDIKNKIGYILIRSTVFPIMRSFDQCVYDTIEQIPEELLTDGVTIAKVEWQE